MGFKLRDVRKAAYVGSMLASEHSMATQLSTTEKPTTDNYITAGKAFVGINHDGGIDFDVAKQAWTPTAYVLAADYVTSKVGLQKFVASRFR